LLRPAHGRLQFGPLDDVDRGEDTFSPLYRDSRYCASCHEGVVFGVPVYTTYSEWLVSPARREGKQCQHCHMAPTGRMTNMAPGHGGVERDPHTLGNHRFFRNSPAAMLRKSIETATHLQKKADSVHFTLQVRATGVGHRAPTGYIDRQLIVLVEGKDTSGKPLLPYSGPTLPASTGPEMAGQPGKLHARALRDFEGHTPAPFWRANPDVMDTRLFPEQNEESTYLFPPNVKQVRVRILYRRFWQEVAQSKGWPDQDLLILDRTVGLDPPR
jgi:hypothetical protein